MKSKKEITELEISFPQPYGLYEEDLQKEFDDLQKENLDFDEVVEFGEKVVYKSNPTSHWMALQISNK